MFFDEISLMTEQEKKVMKELEYILLQRIKNHPKESISIIYSTPHEKTPLPRL